MPKVGRCDPAYDEGSGRRYVGAVRPDKGQQIGTILARHGQTETQEFYSGPAVADGKLRRIRFECQLVYTG